MSRKGITPLISTVFLIVFAIGLGTMVMSWGNSEQYRAEKGCNDVDISITSVKMEKQICIYENGLKVLIENNGKVDIKGVRVIVLMPDSVVTEDIITDVKPGEFRYIDLEKDIDFTKILKIRMIPQTENELCVNKKTERENIGEC